MKPGGSNGACEDIARGRWPPLSTGSFVEQADQGRQRDHAGVSYSY